ncbi:MAG: hypothetical protein OXM02_10985 [Bacteroidota bacterium]|nr:hypothetical protein [Bacteroidota bacterium]
MEQDRLRHLIVGWAGLVLIMSGCTSSPTPNRQVVEAPLVPFGDLFVLQDTIRLDPAVVVGSVDFLDINQEGQLLVTDRISGGTYLFDALGKKARMFSADTCLPETEDSPYSGRFVGGEHFLLVGSGGSVVLFDASGRCIASQSMTDRPMEWATAACSVNDTLFVLPDFIPVSPPVVVAYSLDYERLGTTGIDGPAFPVLNTTSRGFWGRAMECFDDGPYYKYLEWEDARPVRPYDSLAQVHPTFFARRTEDLPGDVGALDRVDALRAFPINAGLYGIDGQTRMVVYWDLHEKWHIESQQYIGIGVVSNAGRFPARSTLSSVVPIGAANGYIYSVGANELMSDGDVGNPVLIRYKFIPPSVSP